MLRTIGIAATAFAAALLASAGTAQAKDCGGEATQAALNACAAASLKEADAALNAAWRDVSGRQSDAGSRTLLVAAQKAWLAWRDAECALSGAGSAGGTLQPMVIDQCLEAMTRERTASLRKLMNCDEGETSCRNPRSAE